MKKKISILIAACAALAVVFAGVNSYAGEGCSSKSKGSKTASGCATSCASKASCTTPCLDKSGAVKTSDMTSSDKSGCGSKANWSSNLCGSKGYYAANVYEVRDGHMYAVCNGKTFEVTANTPYQQVGDARYYFADDASKISCPVEMTNSAVKIEREAVALASVEGNVVGMENGQKVAQCVATGKKFVVTADSPVKLVDGKKYYLSETADLSSLQSNPSH